MSETPPTPVSAIADVSGPMTTPAADPPPAREPSAFERLAAINVGPQTEKKNGMTYLSWAWAWDHLLRQDSAASYVYLDPKTFGGGTVMVYCAVTAFGVTRTAHLPVMDNRNKAIANPDAFAVNTAMQRVLVKAIALHGLGLYIYAGEDVPLSDATTSTRGELSAQVVSALDRVPEGLRDNIDRAFSILNLSAAQRMAKVNEHLGGADVDPETGANALLDWARATWAASKGVAIVKSNKKPKKADPSAEAERDASAAVVAERQRIADSLSGAGDK